MSNDQLGPSTTSSDVALLSARTAGVERQLAETATATDSRLDSIGERVAKLEGQLEEAKRITVRRLVSDYGGLVALILSIATGSFAVYDKLVSDPQRARVQAEVELRNDLNQLATISATIAGLNWLNPQAAQAQANSYTPQRLALLDRINQAAALYPHVVKFADYMELASDYESLAKFPEALKEVELAKTAAESAADSVLIANVYWAKGRLAAKTGNVVLMRQGYGGGVKAFQEAGLTTYAGSIMQLYVQWIAWELTLSDCADVAPVAARMLDEMKSDYVWPQTRFAVGRDFNAMLKQARKTCNLARLPESP